MITVAKHTQKKTNLTSQNTVVRIVTSATKRLQTRHRRTHRGKKTFQCDQCGKAFAQKSNLTTLFKYIVERELITVTCVTKNLHRKLLCQRIAKHTLVFRKELEQMHTPGPWAARVYEMHSCYRPQQSWGKVIVECWID